MDLFGARLLIVTGKGGVGKSTVAAALALAGVRTGRKTCLVEVESRQTMSQLFATQPWDFTEREFRPGLWGLSVDPEASLAEYLDLFYGAGRLSKLVVGSSAVQFATTAAPGVKDVLLIGKVKEMEQRRTADGRFVYDLIVLDAPPTGRIVNFLRAPEAAGELVGVGPIRQQAQSVVDMLVDPRRTRLELVTLLEEMPVQETLEAVAHLAELGVTLGPVIANRVEPPRVDAAQRKALARASAPAAVAKALAGAGLPGGQDIGRALVGLGAAHAARLDLQAEMLARLDGELEQPVLQLPAIHADRFGPDELNHLADVVEEAGS
ncbi:MAG TPA: ArsA-related P-loop ATPase [Egibacteraceae bacterium]|nr:ArsA-related P-loop ATPase [Egibacteraceae bacterium]